MRNLLIILVLVSLAAVVAVTGLAKKYRYYFLNGTVYIQETGGIAAVCKTNASETYYWVDSGREKNSKVNGGPLFNGLAILPTYSCDIPKGEDPFKWAPHEEDIRKQLTAFFKDYRTLSLRAELIGLAPSLNPGETEEQAYTRVINILVKRYCSYEIQRAKSIKPSHQ